MKKIAMICLALVMGAGICTAQKSTGKKQVTTTVFATDIHCDHCAKKVMDNVPSLGKGIKDVEVDVATKRITVTYDPSKNNDANIVKGLGSLKVNAEVVPAAPAEKK